jgi:hypothetical protein
MIFCRGLERLATGQGRSFCISGKIVDHPCGLPGNHGRPPGTKLIAGKPLVDKYIQLQETLDHFYGS